MSFEGQIQNGVVVFDTPIAVPDGTAVRVAVIELPRRPPAERLKNVIRTGVDLPPDLAKNHDHDLHGTPKK
jgi:hypothetical protein